MINTKDNSKNIDVKNQELIAIMLDLSKKINDIHRLHFSEPELKSRKNQKQKFLAEILTTPARNTKKI